MGRFLFMPDYDMDMTCGRLRCFSSSHKCTNAGRSNCASLLYSFCPVVGKNIELPQIDNPSEADVNKYHAMFLQVCREIELFFFCL